MTSHHRSTSSGLVEWCHSRAMAPGLLVCSCGAQDALDSARDAAGDHEGGA